MLFVVSRISGPNPWPEANDLVWYGKTALQDPLLNRPYNERRWSSPGPSDPKYEVKVLRKTPESQILEPFDESKGQVVALVPGQALRCGIGPSNALSSITYLSAKDVLRWSKLSEWLDKYEQRQPRHELAVSQSEDLDLHDTLLWKLLNGPSGKILPTHALSYHVSDLPGALPEFNDISWWMSFIIETKVLFILLVALPLVYGGIHLATWNFHFASQTEHLLWKIACINIMGTIPLGVIFFVCESRAWNIAYRRRSSWEKAPAILVLLMHITWIFFTPLFIFYALSRIYIVVESFISLRHVPIGVYAAIPWVQNIPHI